MCKIDDSFDYTYIGCGYCGMTELNAVPCGIKDRNADMYFYVATSVYVMQIFVFLLSNTEPRVPPEASVCIVMYQERSCVPCVVSCQGVCI